MTLESTFKYFCFVFAVFILWLIYADLAAGKTAFSDYLGNIGLFLICIEMAVLMTYEKLTAEVSLKNFFLKVMLLFFLPLASLRVYWVKLAWYC